MIPISYWFAVWLRRNFMYEVLENSAQLLKVLSGLSDYA